MTGQAPLPFDNYPGPSHRSAPETSHQAALANAPRSGTQRARVLLAIFYADGQSHYVHGMTDDEICTWTGLIGNSVRPRRGELHTAGLIEDSGERRSSWMGHPAVVWRITDEGTRIARELDND